MTEFLRFKTGIFDADGTVVNSGPVNEEAYEYVYKEITGKPFSKKMIADTIGEGVSERFRKILPQMLVGNTELEKDVALYGQEDIVQRCTIMHRQYQSKNISRIKLFPDVKETLGLLRDLGVNLAIVTNRTRSGMFLLEELGLINQVDVVVAGDDVSEMKPSPAGINLALTKLDSDPSKSIMIGDTWRDIAAGKAAGVTTLAALWGEDNWNLIKHSPDLYATRVKDLNRVFIQNFSIYDILKVVRGTNQNAQLMSIL